MMLSSIKWPKLVGIINLSPDSFSNKEPIKDTQALLAQLKVMQTAGVEVVDIGAESTRPKAVPLTAEEEWERLAPFLPLICQFKADHGLRVSLDTRHAATAERAIALGVDWINDVSGCHTEAMQTLLAKTMVEVVVMHSLTVPVDPSVVLPETEDPIMLLQDWAKTIVTELMRRGIATERIILDPGIGFGKTAKQSLAILQQVTKLKFSIPKVRWLVGHSRKSFFSLITSHPPEERDLETYVASLWLAMQGVDYLRVHNIEGHTRFFKVWQWLQG